jgi:hypothetical protein
LWEGGGRGEWKRYFELVRRLRMKMSGVIVVGER